jgi:glycosyltransferase involved in cell wall biosynthesis
MPVRNEESFISRSLGAVVAQDYPADRMEIIVVDGCSTDRTLDIVRDFQAARAGVRVIANPRLTVPYGMNLATEVATGDIIIRVDGHCEIAPDYVRRCVEHLMNDGVDGVGGCLETVGETPVAQSIALALSSKFGVGGVAFRTHRGGDILVDTVPFPAYTRATVESAGPYDEEMKRNQDDEYNYRIREKGGKLLLAQDVKSRYFSRGTLRKLASQYFEYGYWKVRVAQKHPRQMQLRHFVPFAFVSSVVVAAVLSVFFRPARIVLAVILGAYVAADLGYSVRLAREHGWRHLRVLPVAFLLLHVAYGTGFLVGLVRFAGRWGRHHD